MQKNYMVTQGNGLIEARHINPLTVREQKIVLTMVSMIQPTDEDFKDYRISIKEFSEMLGLEGSAKYTEIKEITKDLMSKSIEIPKSDGGWLFANWVSSAEYKTGEGSIALSFSPKLMPYLLQLKNAFTSYRLSNILSLKSTYSIRLYELMKKWQHLGRWECSVESLREKIGVSPDKYPRYANFKARVLKSAVEEVNAKTDLFITFKENKKGRSVERIEFTIRYTPEKEIHIPQIKGSNKKEDAAVEDEQVRLQLNKIANGYSLDRTYFAEMYKVSKDIWNEDAKSELQTLLEYVNAEKTVANPLGFIKSRIKLAWESYQNGDPITFTDLQPSEKRSEGREEKLPEWFNDYKEGLQED